MRSYVIMNCVVMIWKRLCYTSPLATFKSVCTIAVGHFTVKLTFIHLELIAFRMADPRWMKYLSYFSALMN